MHSSIIDCGSGFQPRFTRSDKHFAKDTIGKQLVRAADSISANLAEGHGRYHFNDRLKFCYYARGSLEETKSWISKAMRRKIIATEISEINHALELLPKKLNAYIKSIKRTRDANKTKTK